MEQLVWHSRGNRNYDIGSSVTVVAHRRGNIVNG